MRENINLLHNSNKIGHEEFRRQLDSSKHEWLGLDYSYEQSIQGRKIPTYRDLRALNQEEKHTGFKGHDFKVYLHQVLKASINTTYLQEK